MSYLRRHWIRIVLGLALMVPFVLHPKYPIALIDRLELIAYDTRLELTMPGGVDPRIVIVDVDEESLIEQGHWPWSRDKLARLVTNLIDFYQVDIIGFDMVFAEKDESFELDEMRRIAVAEDKAFLVQALDEMAPRLAADGRFADALRGRRTVLGYFLHSSRERGSVTGQLPPPVFPADSEVHLTTRLTSAFGYTANLPVLQGAAMSGGFFSIPTVDADAVYRRFPLLTNYENGLYESLSLAVARNYLGLDVIPVLADDVSVGLGYPALEGLDVGLGSIPVDEDVAALIPFRGLQGSFRYVPARDVLNRTVTDPEALADTIVLVGTTAVGLVDHRPTPVQPNFPGVEIHANAVAGILDGAFKSRPAFTLAAELLWVAALGLLLVLALPALSAIASSVLALALAAITVAANLYLWSAQNYVLPVAAPVLVIVALYVYNMAYGFLVETRAKRQLGNLFGHYVPPELVEEMSASPEAYTLEGEKRDLTVLFSDVRGFTTISEGMDPKALTQLMNELLTPMTRVVHTNRGTIDKYMGDAMMAFWGAPITNPDHAQDALTAALELESAVDEINERFRERGWPEIRVGIGVNSGEMSVGNMGSEFRVAYTVMGDGVNLGSRLEGLTKFYGVTTIVSESTTTAVHGFVLRPLDRVTVKGKAEPVDIFEPVGRATEVDDERSAELEAYGAALDAYRSRRFDEALERFEALQAREPDSVLYALYRERIEGFRQAPPPHDWDFVFNHESK